jgi:hypothetical protein
LRRYKGALVSAALTLPLQGAPYQVIDRFTVDQTWDGSPKVLLTSQNAVMPQTPNGTMVFAYQNMSTENNSGSISITTGGGAPDFKTVPALVNQPSMLINNWKANNLSITNVSPNDDTPIAIQAIGPGIPGTIPLPLAIGPPGVQLGFGQTAQGAASPQWMQLVVRCDAATTGILALIGGPPDQGGNNGYVFAVNYPIDSGPDTGVTPPEGYYATTRNNSYIFQFSWGRSLVFVANLSSLNAKALEVVLRAL